MRTTKFVAMLVALSPLIAVGADFDGSKPLICAQNEVRQCDVNSCESLTPEEAGVANFLKVDVRKREITDPDSGHASEIVTVSEIDIADAYEKALSDVLVLQGTERGFGWSLSIARETGDTVFAASGEFDALVVFGNCTLD